MSAHLILLIVTYWFIINCKDFWDKIYFDKINHLYNTNCIFGSTQKTPIRKLWEKSKRSLKINRYSKVFLLGFVIFKYLVQTVFLFVNLLHYEIDYSYHFTSIISLGLINFIIDITLCCVIEQSTKKLEDVIQLARRKHNLYLVFQAFLRLA